MGTCLSFIHTYYTFLFVCLKFLSSFSFTVSNDSFECQTGEVRLTDAPDRSGRVEVCINGKWGTVCSFGWGPPEIEVVCQQLRNRPNSK